MEKKERKTKIKKMKEIGVGDVVTRGKKDKKKKKKKRRKWCGKSEIE